jgi:YhcG PDDEXK nuclease domain
LQRTKPLINSTQIIQQHITGLTTYDLKVVEFQPEFVGKLNFYLSAIDDLLKTELDQPSIGLLICKSKDKLLVEYALRDLTKPIGISEYRLAEVLPENIKSALPTIEEIEDKLSYEKKNIRKKN